MFCAEEIGIHDKSVAEFHMGSGSGARSITRYLFWIALVQVEAGAAVMYLDRSAG